MLRYENFPRLVDDKYTAASLLLTRTLTHADCPDQVEVGVAEKRIWQGVLGEEGGVRLGTVAGQSVDVESTTGQIRIVVSERADLRSAYGSKSACS